MQRGPGHGEDRGWRRLLPFAGLYFTFGATLGFIGGGAPILLRERGVALAQIGLLQLIYLPLGLTFTWAIVLDRIRLPLLPHRIGWIAAMQLLSVALLIVLGQGEAWPVPLLFALALAISFAFATMDIALESLVVETVVPAQRPSVTTAKLFAASLGGIVGTGLLTACYGRFGWRASLVGLAVGRRRLPAAHAALSRGGPSPARRAVAEGRDTGRGCAPWRDTSC